MEKTSLNVSISESLKEYVRDRVQEGEYGTPSYYVRGLIREDKRHHAMEKLERLFLEGLNSGSRKMTPKEWQKFRDRVNAAIDERKLQKS